MAKLQHDLSGIEYLIIDEFSVIGQKMFSWINRRYKQATGYSTVPFSGLSIILVGDIAQSPPITDQVFYHTRPKRDLAIEGYCMYKKFGKAKFEINERARARFSRLMKTENRRYPRSSRINGAKSGGSGAFLFSRRVPEFCNDRRSFATNENSNFYRQGRRCPSAMDFAHYQSPYHK